MYYGPDTKLNGALLENTCRINVHKQGEGAINNLAAMRNSPLKSQGVLIDGRNDIDDGAAVVNSDKVTLSPVIHQFDRDSELKGIIRKRTQLLTKKWMQQRNN